MDISAKNIYFNKDGICNFCIDFENKLNNIKNRKYNLDNLLNRIKSKNQTYDCEIGLSGGVDSCKGTLHKAIEFGLNHLLRSLWIMVGILNLLKII